MKCLSIEEVEKVSNAMYNMKDIGIEEKRHIVFDFINKVSDMDNIVGNKSITTGVLSGFLDEDVVKSITNKFEEDTNVWETLHEIDPRMTALYINKEQIKT